MRNDVNTVEKILAKHVDATSGCWEWKARKDKDGYGRTTIQRKTYQAHRVVFAALVGPIPEGMTIDHLCKNKACVNPDHMEVTTVKVNVLRSDNICSLNARKTHCPRGHPLSGENLYLYPAGGRGCRQCQRDHAARYKEMK
jgi:hypothetical protein